MAVAWAPKLQAHSDLFLRRSTAERVGQMHRAVLSVRGSDAAKLLHSLSTNDVHKWLGRRGNTPKVCIEDKLDGDRILLHKRGTEVKVFTRNCKDVTATFGHFFKTNALNFAQCHCNFHSMFYDKSYTPVQN